MERKNKLQLYQESGKSKIYSRNIQRQEMSYNKPVKSNC